MSEARRRAALAREASRELAQAPSRARSEAILAAASLIEGRVATICEANEADVARARARGMAEPLVDRLLLSNPDVTAMVAFTVSATLIFVVIFAKAVGSTLPILAEKIGIDPAVMASPLISTITDAVSLLIYFTMATFILHI